MLGAALPTIPNQFERAPVVRGAGRTATADSSEILIPRVPPRLRPTQVLARIHGSAESAYGTFVPCKQRGPSNPRESDITGWGVGGGRDG